MSFTRRPFALAVVAAVVLVVLGCSDGSDGSSARGKLELPDKPFTVGGPEQYREAGVYRNYRLSSGIWLVSDGRQLVALSAACTYEGCGTQYDSTSRIFKCPCHNSTFSTEGLNRAGSKAQRPLERCKIGLVEGDDGAPVLQVDPTKRYRQEIEDRMSGRNWASPHSVFVFAPVEEE